MIRVPWFFAALFALLKPVLLCNTPTTARSNPDLARDVGAAPPHTVSTRVSAIDDA